MNHFQNIQNAAYVHQAAATDAPPQPTDMQTHIGRAQELGARLDVTLMRTIELTGRLYGEGVSASDKSPAPRSAGLCSEMCDALSHIEAVAERLDQAVMRLSQFA